MFTAIDESAGSQKPIFPFYFNHLYENYDVFLSKYNKKPPLFKKLFQSGSVEEEAMQIFMAKKKAEDMRDQLRQIIQLTRGHNAWQELLKTEADIRTRRQKAVYDQQERQRMWIEGTAIVLLILVAAGVIGFIVWGVIQRNGGI